MKRSPDQHTSTRRRGVILALIAVSTITLLVCASLAVDVGYICALTAEQQNNADAGALAGAVALQEGDTMSVMDYIKDIIARNQKMQGYLSLEDQVIDIGWWHPVDMTFTPLPDPVDWPERGYAVRVRAFRTNAPLFFARLMGHHSTTVWREAITVGSELCKGIWGVEGVRIPGNVYTDSYDSTVAPYDPEKAGDEGDVCSGRGIDGMGSVEIYGDMMTGLGYWPNLAGDAGVFPSGTTTSSIDGMVGPSVEVPPDLGSSGSVDLKAFENLTLDPGTYVFDSITMRAGSSITVTGPTTIYVNSLSGLEGKVNVHQDDSGDITAIGKGFINLTEDPHNLTIIAMGDEAILNGTSTFYGSVIAPNADVILSGTSDYYGLVIGKTVLMRGDFQFHVDESLPWHDIIKPAPIMLVK